MNLNNKITKMRVTKKTMMIIFIELLTMYMVMVDGQNTTIWKSAYNRGMQMNTSYCSDVNQTKWVDG